jgi:hypothetical protein
LPAGTNWNFDVHWYPKIPGVISASSFDGKVGFYNIEVSAYFIFMVVQTVLLYLSLMTSNGKLATIKMETIEWIKR